MRTAYIVHINQLSTLANYQRLPKEYFRFVYSFVSKLWLSFFVILCLHVIRISVCLLYSHAGDETMFASFTPTAHANRWRLSLFLSCRSCLCKRNTHTSVRRTLYASVEHKKWYESVCTRCSFYSHACKHLNTWKTVTKRRNFESKCLWSVRLVYF